MRSGAATAPRRWEVCRKAGEDTAVAQVARRRVRRSTAGRARRSAAQGASQSGRGRRKPEERDQWCARLRVALGRRGPDAASVGEGRDQVPGERQREGMAAKTRAAAGENPGEQRVRSAGGTESGQAPRKAQDGRPWSTGGKRSGEQD